MLQMKKVDLLQETKAHHFIKLILKNQITSVIFENMRDFAFTFNFKFEHTLPSFWIERQTKKS